MVSVKQANFLQFFWNLVVFLELEFGRKWLKARFQKTVTNFMYSFKKLSPVYAVSKKITSFMSSFKKKMSTLSVVWVKPFVILQKKKKTRLQVVILIACKKKQNRVAKFWNSVRFFSYSFFWTFLFFPRTIFQICNLESTFYVFFFSFIFSNFTLLQRVLSNSNETENGFTETIWNFLKLFATVIFSLKLAAKKK